MVWELCFIVRKSYHVLGIFRSPFIFSNPVVEPQRLPNMTSDFSPFDFSPKGFSPKQLFPKIGPRFKVGIVTTYPNP
jgi:hypothetical protein